MSSLEKFKNRGMSFVFTEFVKEQERCV